MSILKQKAAKDKDGVFSQASTANDTYMWTSAYILQLKYWIELFD